MTTYRFSRGSQVIQVYGPPLIARRRSLVTIRAIEGEREDFLTRTGPLEGLKDVDLVVIPCDETPPYPCKISIFYDSWRETQPGSGLYQRLAQARVVPIPEGDQVVLESLEGDIHVSHPDYIAIGVEDEVYANSASWVADNLEFMPAPLPAPLPAPPADCPLEVLVDGPADGAATVLLVHGAGAPMDSPFQAAIATDLAARGWRVVRFEFPYMARARQLGRRQAPDRMPVLQEAFRQQVRQQRLLAPDQPLVVGGKSMGGRVASLLVDELAASLGVRGCLCFGFPFHPPGRPLQGRADHLATLHTPTLILQGERDSFGRRQELAAVPFSPQVQLAWILDGDHSFRPGRRSGASEAANLRAAVEHSDAFLRALLSA